MRTKDGLANVFRGAEGSGEAQIINNGPGMQLADIAIYEARRARDKKEEELKELKEQAELGSGSVSSNWAQSNFDYYGPKSVELRSKFPEIMRQIQQENDPVKKAVLKQQYSDQWKKLEEEAKTDNAIYNEYQKVIQSYEKNPDKFDNVIEIGGKKYSVEDAQKILANPKADPRLAQQVEEAGGVSKWRAQNWREFIPEPAYDPLVDIKKQGVKLDMWQEGELKEIGGEKGVVTKSGIKEDRLNSIFDPFWSRTNRSGDKYREMAENAVDQFVNIVEDNSGNKILASETPEMVAAIDDMLSKEKGLTIEEQKKRLPYYYGKKVFNDYHKGEEKFQRIPNYYQQIVLKSTPSGGNANTNKITIPDYYNATIDPVMKSIVNQNLTPEQQFLEVSKALNLGDNSGSIVPRQLNNGGYVLDLPAPPQKMNAQGEPVQYQFMGRNVLLKGGNVFVNAPANGMYSGRLKGNPIMMFKDKNGVTTLPADPTAIPYLQAVFLDDNDQQFKAQFDLTNPDDRNMANQTLYYGSSGMSQFNTNYKNVGTQNAAPEKPKRRKPPVSAN